MASMTDCPDTLAIVGTGEFARALASRALDCGLRPVIGSRNPELRQDVPADDILAKVKVTSLQDCVSSSDVIVLAIHPEHQAGLRPLQPLLVGKVLVDVSNSLKTGSRSNAQTLADLFSKSDVVKAFNTVSAYALLTKYQNCTTFVCGDRRPAKQVVKDLAGRLGISAVDAGALAVAGKFEESNRRLFPGWGWPTLVTLLIFLFWAMYTMIRYHYQKGAAWYRLPVNIMNKMAGATSATLLGLCYIPGSIAAFKQLVSGTKHKRFHKSLDRFLKMRKELGLYAFFFGLMHLLMSMAILNPDYFGGWFDRSSVVVPVNQTEDLTIKLDSRMNRMGEVCTLFGFLSMMVMGVVGLTSIPSIADSLNWREWRFVQSYMGLVSLIFAIAHVTIKGATGWVTEDWKDIISGMAFLPMLLPWFALLLRLFFLLPCVYTRVNKIRRGWVRGEPTAIKVVIEGGGPMPNGIEVSDFDNMKKDSDMKQQSGTEVVLENGILKPSSLIDDDHSKNGMTNVAFDNTTF